MRNIKSYPHDKNRIFRDIVDRSHYLNIMYAIAIIVTFQCAYSFSWYCYIAESYFHLFSETKSTYSNFNIFVHLLYVPLVYQALFAKTLLFALIISAIQLLHAIFRSFELMHFSVDAMNGKFSDYDYLTIIYSLIMLFTYALVVILSIISVYFHTPIVLIATESKNEENLRSIVRSFNKKRVHGGSFRNSSKNKLAVSDRLPEGSNLTAATCSTSGMVAQFSEKADVTVTSATSENKEVSCKIPDQPVKRYSKKNSKNSKKTQKSKN